MSDWIATTEPAIRRGEIEVAAATIAAALGGDATLTARDALAALADRDPRDASWLFGLTRLATRLGETAAASAYARQTVTLRPDAVGAWLQLAVLAGGRLDLAEAILDESLAANPHDPRLAEGKVLTIRNLGEGPRAEAYLETLLPDLKGQAWVHFHLGDLAADPARGVAHLRRAHELAPDVHIQTLLAQTLARHTGEGEGARLEEAQAIARQVLQSGAPLNAGHLKILWEVFAQACAFDDLARLGDVRALGQQWAQSGRHSALMRLMPWVASAEDRLQLLAQHRLWGAAVEARAAGQPIRMPPRQATADSRLRVGFMSSDLRRHAVSSFALPLFDHLDPSQVEVFCYSYFQGREDALQARIASRVSAFRWMPGVAAREAAQRIADDRLDILVELGGATAMNRLEAMAWRPAPVQASWLGYPHSVGLNAIDRFICDPHTLPADPALLAEQPLLMPRSWIALGEAVFGGHPDIAPGLPQDREGALTFGTANAPYKFTPQVLRAWAQVVAAVPGSRFAFIRPEAGAATFRAQIEAQFTAQGVGPDRLVFHPVRGRHMALYNRIDISLDTFPLTGGATTVDALWMGVPVVSLRGPAVYERLSASILANAGLGDLVADDLEGFTQTAHRLAADRPRRLALREGLRAQIRQSPLGDTETFARDFYAMLAGAARQTQK